MISWTPESFVENLPGKAIESLQESILVHREVTEEGRILPPIWRFEWSMEAALPKSHCFRYLYLYWSEYHGEDLPIGRYLTMAPGRSDHFLEHFEELIPQREPEDTD